MSKAMFDRQMKWRNERDTKTKTTRKELGREQIYKDNLGVATQDEHVESYYRYRQLVGEADGGEMLGEEAYSELQRKAAAAATDRLFVFYRCTPRALDCYTIGPDSRCYCAHSYKSHAWYNNKDKNVHCRVPGCKCSLYDYIPGHGTMWPKCLCKHNHEDHRKKGLMGRCQRCACSCFNSMMSCQCTMNMQDHCTLILRRSELPKGKSGENLAGGGTYKDPCCSRDFLK